MKREGQIKVHSENMFPIIKKWLYSDKDIFLREIVSNSCDAIRKLEKLKEMGDAEGIDFVPRVDICLDKENKIISITDNGIGMTEEEVEKYITQIAFSGAEEFLERYKDKAENSGIIGHFGLGFYSAFMVSDSVEIDTLSYLENSKPVHWKSDGGKTYEIEDGTKGSRGTTITLNISDSSLEFLDESKITQILRKYCHFMPYEIYFNSRGNNKDEGKIQDEHPINNISPLWKKSPKECTKEEYEQFYSEVFMDFNKPLFWIHLNVDFPFSLKGILYFPKQKNTLEIMPGEVKLFSNQVYIADNIKEVVPEFLMLLKGVMDCPDLPLNVSRSFLQNDEDVAKISRHITKKISDKLHSIFNDNRKEYEGYWNDISPFIKFGCIKDDKFYDKIKDIILFETINGEYFTISEYPVQLNEKIFYVTDENTQFQYIHMFKESGSNAVILNHIIDPHFISFLEYKENNLKFARIDSEINGKIDKQGSEDISDTIIERFKDLINDNSIDVKAEYLKNSKIPAIVILSEQERRMQDISAIYNMEGLPNMPKAKTTVILNLENEAIKKIPDFAEEKGKMVCKYIYDLALLSHRQLKPEEMSEFLELGTEILKII